MTISPFAPGALATRRTTDLFASLRGELTDLQRQLATGKTADTYAGLGPERRVSLDLRGRLAAIESYEASIGQAELRLKLMTQGVVELGKLADALKGDLIQPSFDLGADGRTSAQKRAEDGIRLAIDILNQEIDGRHLFAGRATDIVPVESYDRIMNGDPAAGRAGLKQLIAERTAAELGSGGLGRLALTAGPAGVQLTGEAALPPFGFTLGPASATGSAVAATSAAGPPSSVGFNLVALPADGDTVTFELRDQDGVPTTITLTARTASAASTGTFAIGATPAATAANLAVAVDAAVREAAQTVLRPRAALVASTEFFAGTAATPPQRVAGPPFATATAMVAGTAANTMIWYKGDDAPSARETAPVRVDAGLTIATGAQANEAPIQALLAQFGALAAETFVGTPVEAERYRALAAKIGPDPASGPTLDVMGTELANAQVSLKNARERQGASRALFQTTLDELEHATPEEVASAILALQTRLQASYQTTALMSQLSLVNYL